MNITFIRLVDKEDLADETCALLSTEWPKSIAMRKRKLLTSPSPHLPVSMLMVSDGTLIGHYRVSEALENSKWCIVESVIIHAHRRGLGLGARLMEHCLKFAESLSMERMFLSTKDKMGFYARLGFSNGYPVSVLSKTNAIFRGKHLLDSNQKTSIPGVVWMSKDLKND